MPEYFGPENFEKSDLMNFLNESREFTAPELSRLWAEMEGNKALYKKVYEIFDLYKQGKNVDILLLQLKKQVQAIIEVDKK